MDKTFYKNILDSLDFAIVEHEMIYDDYGKPIDYTYSYVNQTFCNNFGLNEKDIIGKTLYEVLPNTEYSWIERYNEVLITGKPQKFIEYANQFNEYISVFAFKSGENKFVSSFKNITEIVKASEPQYKEEIMANVFDVQKTAYFEFDLKKKIFEYSDVLPEIIGMEIVTYKDYMNLFKKKSHPEDRERVTKLVNSIFKGENNEIAIQIRFFNEKKNKYVWISYFAYVEKRYRKVPIVIRGLLKDIDDEKRQSLELENVNKMFEETRKIANIATFRFSFSKGEYVHSKELDDFCGIENLIKIEQLYDVIHPDDVSEFDYSTEEIQKKPNGVVGNYRMYKDGQVRYIQSTVFGEKDVSGKVDYVFGILKDNTDLEKSKREIEYFANHDLLTGLYNRNYFEEVSKKYNTDSNAYVFICDVDGLKLVNDAFGHIEGDKLLIHLAKVLKSVCNDELVFRIGGDEFVIIIPKENNIEPKEYEEEIKKEIVKFDTYGVGFDASIGYSDLSHSKTFEEAFRTAENLMYRRKLTERKSRKSTALRTILQTMHERTEETEEHCQRVGEYAVKLLKSIGRNRDYEVEDITLVADLHDIGKISTSDKILLKPGKLDNDEYEKMKEHSESGYKIVSNIIDNEDIAIAVLHHHEQYDGKGYPHGLIGENIPLYSRIIAICDAYDAMITDRVYRAAQSKEFAISELEKNSGTQFDPKLVTEFVKLIK